MTSAVHCVCTLTCNNTQSVCMSSHHPFSTPPASPSTPLLLLPFLPRTLDSLAATSNPLATGGVGVEDGEERPAAAEAVAAVASAEADSAGSGGTAAAIAVPADVAMVGVLVCRELGRGEKMRGGAPEMMLCACWTMCDCCDCRKMCFKR